MKNIALLLFTLPFLFSCQNPVTKAVNKVEYSAYELVGIQKRDLLKTRIQDTKDEQKEASKDFQDALQRLKSVYGFKGGKLEKQYDTLKASYEKASGQASVVHKSIRKVETVARDLFEEWQKEIGEMETESLKAKSQESLADTRQKFEALDKGLKASEAKMDPVLHKLKDHVLFMKHNLNAQAIGSLKRESAKIQIDIEDMLAEMNKSISMSDQFIEQMNSK